MAANQTKPKARTVGGLSSGRLYAVRLLILVALVLSGYLAWVSFSHGTAVGCGPDSACDKVLQSRWSSWFGIPVSLLAVGVDALILGWSFGLHAATTAAERQRAWNWLVPCSVLVAGGAIWFVGLQIFAVRAMCPYCMTAHAAGFGAALLLLLAAPRREAPGGATEVYLTPARFRLLSGAAAVGLALLAFGQVVYRPKTFVVKSITELTNESPRPAVTSAVASSSLSTTAAAAGVIAAGGTEPAGRTSAVAAAATPAPGAHPVAVPAGRLFPVYEGRFELKLHEVPVLGAFTNAQVIVSLFDYTCHHCRAMHPTLVEVQRAFSNQLVIASLPMPLDPGCNRTMSRPHPKHTNACEYARLGLTVWRANPSKHPEYDEWLMKGEDQAPPIEEARQKAIDLAGAHAFEQASQDPWVAQQLAQDVAIYEFAYRAGQGSMPQMIVASNTALGIYPRDELFKLVGHNLGLTNGMTKGK